MLLEVGLEALSYPIQPSLHEPRICQMKASYTWIVCAETVYCLQAPYIHRYPSYIGSMIDQKITNDVAISQPSLSKPGLTTSLIIGSGPHTKMSASSDGGGR